MSRTVAAMYDSRAEAELARVRLTSDVKATSPRIISKDTAAAIDTLDLSPRAVDSYRDGLRRGGHLLIARVPRGTKAEQVIQLLKQSAGNHADQADESWTEVQQGFKIDEPKAEPAPATADRSSHSDRPPEQPRPVDVELAETPTAPAAVVEGERAPVVEEERAPVVQEERVPVVQEELRIGKREVARGGARVRSFTRESPAEEQVALLEESIEVESRPSERRLSDNEVQAGGLFQERAFEIAEMREEAVITKEAVVREEVIVRKTVKERTETVRDTVRHTEIEVEDLSEAGVGAASTATAGRARPQG